MSASQFVFDLEPLRTFDESDFFIAPCNEQAIRLVSAWPDWPAHGAVIYGPQGSGKTHLARIWRKLSAAKDVKVGDLKLTDLLASTPPFLVEDIDQEAFDERTLFHCVNHARECGSFVLLTARTAPGQWSISLPDLRSRMRSFAAIRIDEPDDELLAAVLVKHFSDRQLRIAPDLIPYLLPRMERSMRAAEELVATLDQLSLAEHRKVTKAFAAKALKTALADEEGA